MVIAVDPAALSPHLVLPNVHHVQCKSELAGDASLMLLHLLQAMQSWSLVCGEL